MPELEAKRDPSQVLFPEIEVCGRRVRPWTLGQLADIGPDLAVVVDELRKAGPGALDRLDGQILAAALRVLPAAIKILAVSLREPEQHVRELDLDTTARLLGAVIRSNWEYLKNSLSLERVLESRRTQGQT